MRIVTVESSRADAVPLRPVIAELRKNHEVTPKGFYDGYLSRCVYDNWPDKPDLLMILGDRYESLGMAWSATYHRIPIAHIHGGEASFGSFDNQIRDAISKLSHIHFVAAEPFKQRLMDIGEDEDRIHVVGAPGLDNLVDLPERKPGKYFVATYHPATIDGGDVMPLLEATEIFADYDVFWTDVNNDPGSMEIRERIEQTCEIWSGSPEEYIRLCRQAAAVIGNSSSGLIEAPTLEVPTVNVGSRQDGRLKGPSVFDCKEDIEDIVRAMNEALDYTGPYTNPYGEPGASKKIADILSTVEIDMRKEW